jgi:hypothetical protein
MGLDIRWPIGLMFTLIGLLLTGYGALKAADSVSLGININLIWGIVLLGFGALMLLGAMRGGKNPPSA